RHTRFSRDWSSDVCSSDLTAVSRELGDRLGGAGEHLAAKDVVALADQPGGAHQHVSRADAQELGRPLRRLVRGLEPEAAGEAIGDRKSVVKGETRGLWGGQ